VTPSFTVSQSAITPAAVTVTDTSTAVTGTITQRRIYISDAFGNYLTGDGTVNYTAWPLVNASITLSVLTQDTAANIEVDWLDVSNVVVETLNANYPLSEFGKQFLFYLVQLQGLTPGVYQDSNYSGNLALFWTNIIAGDNAVTYGNSLSAAQNCYNREIYMMQNQADYF
jgi:hypothetical protein